MICSICGVKNSKFDVKCRNCSAFLQSPVRVLNFFEILYLLFSSPRIAFHKIIISERKNFVVLLIYLFGVYLSVDIFYLLHAGEKFDNLISLMFIIFAIGSVVGSIFVLCISLVLKLLFKFSDEKPNFKSLFALLSYITAPMSISISFLLPAKLSVFGIYYFTETPKPYDLKPIPFYIFVLIDLILKLYSLSLLFIAINYITESLPRAVFFMVLTSICMVVLLNLLKEATNLLLFN
jgi:hypothetical protein